MGRHQKTLDAARRLLKNRLRHLISSTKAEDDATWSSIAFVNEAAATSAQDDWNEFCSNAWVEGPPEELILTALGEAVADVRREHETHVSTAWLEELLESFQAKFKPSDLTP